MGRRAFAPGWALAAIAVLTVVVVLLGLLWITPLGDQLLGRPGIATITSITLTVSGSASTFVSFPPGEQGSCADSCHLAPETGSEIELFLTGDSSSPSNWTFAGLTVSPPFGFVSSTLPFEVSGSPSTFGLTVVLKAPSAPGSYALSLTLVATALPG
ncbi:MAG: hypothetical protein ACRECR_02235 [Thermoplasmata archaeon]